MNRKSYPERVRSALFHAIKKTAANLDACVKAPGKDFSRKGKLPLQTMLLMLIGMISNLQLPNSEEFDVDTTLTLTRRQTKETLELLSAYPERYRGIQPHTTFDYIAPKDPKMYDLRFRVVRFRISGGCYETVYTNLDSETFPLEKSKNFTVSVGESKLPLERLSIYHWAILPARQENGLFTTRGFCAIDPI